MSIADRPGVAAGFVGGSNCQLREHLGSFGALAAGFLAGYLVNPDSRSFAKNFQHHWKGVKPVLLYPVFGVLLMGLSMD